MGDDVGLRVGVPVGDFEGADVGTVVGGTVVAPAIGGDVGRIVGGDVGRTVGGVVVAGRIGGDVGGNVDESVQIVGACEESPLLCLWYKGY